MTQGLLTWLNKYITAEGGGGSNEALHAIDRPGGQKVGPWESFEIQPSGDAVTLKSSGGYYWAAESGGGSIVTCNRKDANPNPDSWERFYLIHHDDGSTSLQAAATGLFVTCETDGHITCTRTVIGPWEAFRLQPPGSVYPPPVQVITPVHSAGKLFRTADEAPWRWKGVSAFRLMNRWLAGEGITPFLGAYQGYNLLRVWPYVNPRDWGSQAWDSPSPTDAVRFLKAMNELGWYVEFTLLTDNDPARVPQAKDFIAAFTAAGLQGTVFLEAANEPEVQHNGNYDTRVLQSALAASGFEYASGNYIDGAKNWYGTYLTYHPSRDAEWPRRAHDGYDYWTLPNDAPPGAQAVKAPSVADEPAKLQDVGGNRPDDWLAFFGSASFFGGGATFHSETGKYGLPPTAEEQVLAAKALEGMNAFPADAPLGLYRRIDDNTLRTYVVGDAMARIRPTTPDAPLSGFHSLEPSHILWAR
jgi:hypothetical protein